MKVKKMPLLLAVLIITTVFLQVPASAAGATAVNTVGINSGSTYYIMNRHNGQYLSVASNSDSNGTNVCTLDFTQSATQQWRTVLNSDGSYTLYAVSSQSGRVLHYRSSDSNLVIWAHVNNYSPQKFNLIRRTTSSYSGLYQIKNGSLYVSLASSGNNVIATSSATETKTLWSFIPVTKGDADLYAFKYALCTILGITFYYDTTGCANAFTTKCNSLGYSPFFFKNKTAYSAYNNLQNDSIFVFVGHG
ncbi:MAG: RICIN domain-containing protein, partial [Clostridia bacterium]|nr:RICIN domain-containing protein [Clostridia bacterium]